MRAPKSIVITGASSGIGAALARRYAAPGVTLGLMGRSGERLAQVAAECTAHGAEVRTGSVDARDEAAMRAWLLAFDDAHPADLVIANAGIAAGFAGEEETAQQTRDIFAVNLGGVLNSLLPLLPRLAGRKRGQIAIMSSLASMRGLPSCPAYSASKAAVRFLGEGLRGSLKKDGVSVCVICPGFIRTPMTDSNPFPMPLIMSADKAARIIERGLAANRARIAFPLLLYIPLWLLSCLSPLLTDPFFAALPKKTGMQKG